MKLWLFVLLFVSTQPLSALELTLGRGVFDLNAELKGMMKTQVDLDITSLSIAQPKTQLFHSAYSWSASVDIFQSATINKVTDFIRQPANSSLPFIDSSADEFVSDVDYIPVPTDYRVYGVDMNVALSRLILEHERGTFNLGVVTGVSMPFMETKNTQRNADVFLDLLETTSTEIITYKLGLSLEGDWQWTEEITTRAAYTLAKQYGCLDNELLGSGIDIEGQYSLFDLSIRWQKEQWPAWIRVLKHGYLTAGYQYVDWDYQQASFSFQQAQITVPTKLDMNFLKSTLYMGVGLRF